MDTPVPLPVLDFLRHQIDGTLPAGAQTLLRYPTAISQLLDFRLIDVGLATAEIELDADPARHGNQQGTVHGGMLCELADAAIGTAHSTVMLQGESFTSIDLKATFLRPVWKERLRAHAHATHRGRTVSHYVCDITREDGKPVASISSAVLTLRGDGAKGR
ncbi:MULTISPECIES: PaaI family thioesterase [unclassified Achromobacter]|uniref:PaaI family thioesterase n=1 Tax=unclassified Achromobacter TaxID=2626865 RepID=UPI000B5150C1|nr:MULTISPECIES: PaaI family thioesterase [unclassified Achromobacter]OWT80723.1 thioesterase [Achromobacter sp. HZ34]OWT81239.1 thioesterase [Achromobacter sp. HZ28]